MIYITGDTHRDFGNIARFCLEWETSSDDVMIILGDVGINYHGNPNDYELKTILSDLPITLFCLYFSCENARYFSDEMNRTPCSPVYYVEDIANY